MVVTVREPLITAVTSTISYLSRLLKANKHDLRQVKYLLYGDEISMGTNAV